MNNKIEQLLNEWEELKSLEKECRNMIDDIKTKLRLVQDTLQLSHTWKQGRSADGYLIALENLYKDYSKKLVNMEYMWSDIIKAQKDTKSRLDAEIVRGPKF